MKKDSKENRKLKILMISGWAVAAFVIAVVGVYIIGGIAGNRETDGYAENIGFYEQSWYDGSDSFDDSFERSEGIVLDGTTVATVNGISIGAEDVGFRIPEAEWMLEYEYFTMFPDEWGWGFDYDREFRDGLTLGRVVREEAAKLAAINVLYMEYAQQHGISLSPQEVSAFNSEIDSMRMDWTPNEFDAMLREDGIQGHEHLRRIHYTFGTMEAVIGTIMHDPDKFAEFERFIPGDDELFGAKHIMLNVDLFESPEEAMLLANELHERALAGEDFDELIATYTHDPLAEWTPDGFTLINGAAIPEFEEAVLALEIGEIGEPVMIHDGLHIMKRIEPDRDNIIFSFEMGPADPTQKMEQVILRGFEAKLEEAELVFKPELDTVPVGFVEF